MHVDLGARPTVGREPELAELAAALEDVAGGTSACVALDGEPGIGKTRLLGELRRLANERGYLVLGGVAAEFERDLPFSVWVDALDAYVADEGLDPAAEWDADLGGELAAILPSLRRPGESPSSSVADERYRAHRAVRALLEVVAVSRPLVVVLDDMHWSDDASIELLAALLRRGPDAPVLFALAFRPAQAPRRLSASLAVPSTRRISLGQLTEADATSLLGELDTRSVAAIYVHSGGNPFYLEQLARAGAAPAPVSAQGSGRSGNGGVSVPPAVAASLAEEIASLLPPQRALLEAAAVAGEPFDPDLAAAVAELTPAEALAALDALLAVDLVRETAVPRRFAFRHPLVRRAVYESTPGGWKLAAHARAAEALGARGAAAVERAHHVEQAANQGDEDAIELLWEAGAASASRAPSAAVRWYEAVLRLLPSGDRERQVEVRVALASALRSLGDLEGCRGRLLEAVGLLPDDAAARRVELTALCASVEHWLGRHEQAHARLVRTWDELPDRSTAAAAALGIELAVDGLYELDFEQVLASGRAALATAREVGDPALLAAALSALCLGESAAGEIDTARGHYDEACTEVGRLEDAELAPRLEMLCYLGWAANYLERYADSIAHADRGVAIARANGEGRLLVPMMLVKGYPLEMQGRMAEAIELCDTAVAASRMSASPHDLFWSLWELGWARYFSGDLEGAIVACEESRDVGGRLAGGTMPASGGGPGWPLSCALFESGKVERAYELIHSLGSDDLPHKVPVERCYDWETMALVELALGRPEKAGEYADRAEKNAARLGLQVPTAVAGRARAAVLLAAGESLEAARVATASAEAAASVGARLQGAMALSLAGRALSMAGERDRAIPVLREAERVLDECESVRMRDEMRRELRKLGARSEKRGPATGADSGVASLTDRELEIARLVTDRKTNKEIAGTLFLSTKTIEAHLRNIFVKLEVSSRVDVARLVELSRPEDATPPT